MNRKREINNGLHSSTSSIALTYKRGKANAGVSEIRMKFEEVRLTKKQEKENK